MWRQKSITFLCHVVGENGVSVDEIEVKAIADLKEPQNVHEVRRFMGMVNQLGKFLPNLATMTEPIRCLLSKENECVGNRTSQDF